MSSTEDSVAGLAVLYFVAAFGGYTLYFMKNGIQVGRMNCRGILGKLDIPPLIGMLWFGFLAINAIHPVVSQINKKWPTYIRNLCQCVILMRSGLGLNVSNLRNLKGPVFMLSWGPQVCEWIVIAVTIKFCLELPWDLALAAAFMLAAVSPAVVIPICLKLKERGYGNDKNIQEVLIGVTSIDSITAIVAFGIVAGIALTSLKGAPDWFGSTTITAGIIVPIIIIGGLILGFGTGFGLFLLKRAHWLVYLIVLSILSLVYVYVTLYYSLSGLSYIAIVIMCLISIKSRKDEEVRKIGKVMVVVWRIVEVILFGLIGAAMDIEKIKANTVGYAVLAIFVGEIIKFPIAFAATATVNFNMKERIYLTLCRMPKATVQASLGGFVLSLAQDAGDKTYEAYGQDILTTAAIGIMITTPIALIIMTLAPYLLTLHDPSKPSTAPPLSPIIEVKADPQADTDGKAELIEPINSPDEEN